MYASFEIALNISGTIFSRKAGREESRKAGRQERGAGEKRKKQKYLTLLLSTGLEPMTLALSEPRATNCAKRASHGNVSKPMVARTTVR